MAIGVGSLASAGLGIGSMAVDHSDYLDSQENEIGRLFDNSVDKAQQELDAFREQRGIGRSEDDIRRRELENAELRKHSELFKDDAKKIRKSLGLFTGRDKLNSELNNLSKKHFDNLILTQKKIQQSY